MHFRTAAPPGLSILAAVVLLPWDAAAQATPPIDPLLARKYFSEARSLTRRDGGRLWGRVIDPALLLVDPATRTAVADEPDSAGTLEPREGLYTGTLPSGENTYNGRLRWAGRDWAMVLWPLPRDSLERGRLLIHELWHRIQHALGLPAANPANPHLSTRAGRLWLRLEGRALAQAVVTRGADRRRAIADAVAFRKHRRSLASAADSTERSLERNEGLAEDTGVALAATDSASRIALVLRRLRQMDSLEQLDRSFPYRTGPAYGLLLDDLAPGWRRRLAPGDDLGGLAGAAAGSGGETGTVEQRAARYGYVEVAAEEDAREGARQQRLSTLRSRLVDGPVLVLPLAEMKVSFDPDRVESLPGSGTVYQTLRIVDRWGILVASRGGALISPDWTRAAVPVPADPVSSPPAGDGWTLELTPGWRIVPGSRPGDWTLRGP